MIRTDLAVESVESLENTDSKKIEGVIKQESNFGNIAVVKVKITSKSGEKAVGKPMGTYVTITTSDFAHSSTDNVGEALRVATKEISSLIKDKTDGGVLVVGLGNSSCTPDALGPKAASRILVTRHMAEHLSDILEIPDMTKVSSVTPGVLGQTGLETAELIKGVVDKISPSLVIVIDALAARSMDRLGRTIQISDTGISPGSGVGNARRELTEQTIGIPVISIGIPTVVDAVTMAQDILGSEGTDKLEKERTSMIVTPREIDLLIEHSADIISMALNKALHPMLSNEDLYALVG